MKTVLKRHANGEFNIDNIAHEKNFLILGCGYVGSSFFKKRPDSFITRRSIQTDKDIKFELSDKSTWNNLRNVDKVLWTFPAASNELEIEFVTNLYEKYFVDKKTIILSSTSAYLTEKNDQIINENSPINLANPRFNAEEKLRKMGALILHLSGIIGPNRIPRNWYNQNKVLFGLNTLNYIHVDDIIYFIDSLFEKFESFQRFNLTSADYKSHNQILNLLKQRRIISEKIKIPFTNLSKDSKRVDNKKILEYLECGNYKFKKYPEDVEI